MRPEDLVHHLSDSSFFHGLAPEERLSLTRLGRLVRHAPGDEVFRPGQPPNALILVIEGLTEISRTKGEGGIEEPVAYAGPGTVLAESKVITGTPFGSTARFPEGGASLQWPRAAILRRLVASQEFSMQYLQHVARRLEGSLSGMDAARSRLEGSLGHFDLPTILQTVVESGSRGVVEIRNARGNIHGSMHIADRLVGPIYCGPLVGADAFLEILVTPPDEGTFTIDPTKPVATAGSRWQLASLLFEAARVSDEYRRFENEIDDHVELTIAARQPELSGDVDPGLVEQIWAVLQARPMGWGELPAHISRSRAIIALAVRDLLVAGSVRPVGGEFQDQSQGDHHG